MRRRLVYGHFNEKFPGISGTINRFLRWKRSEGDACFIYIGVFAKFYELKAVQGNFLELWREKGTNVDIAENALIDQNISRYNILNKRDTSCGKIRCESLFLDVKP